MVNVDEKKRRVGPSPSLLLLLLALTLVVAAGATFLVLRTSGDPLDHPAHPLSDDQTRAQVVEPTKQIVALGNLQGAAGGYTLMSCKNQTDPPYQGAIYLTFALPKSLDYFDRIAATMVLVARASLMRT